MSAPAVAVSPDGKRFAAAWKDVREGSPRVWWAFSSEPRFGREAAVGEERTERNHPSLAADDHDEFWAAWEEGRGRTASIRARRSDPGEPSRAVSDATEGTPAFPGVACAAGLVVVAWEEQPASGGSRVLVRVLDDARR